MRSPGGLAAKGPAGRVSSSIPGSRRDVSLPGQGCDRREEDLLCAYFWLPEKKAWKHLVTFRTITGGTRLESPHSFIEDFRRDGKSATEVRRAVFGNGWVGDAAGSWTPLREPALPPRRDVEAKDTIDAGTVNDRFYLQTGGDTHATTKLQGWDRLPGPLQAAAGGCRSKDGLKKKIPLCCGGVAGGWAQPPATPRSTRRVRSTIFTRSTPATRIATRPPLGVATCPAAERSRSLGTGATRSPSGPGKSAGRCGRVAGGRNRRGRPKRRARTPANSSTPGSS